MTRRKLVEGLKEFGVTDAEAVSDVIVGGSPTEPSQAKQVDSSPQLKPPLLRVPLTSRIRQDISHAMKRASLERQLNGQSPHEIQEIIEEALTPWLKARGYLP